MENCLEIRDVHELNHHFIIPSFQRGYRWERLQVKQLLEDLIEHYETKKEEPYYLQPIVVSKNKNGDYEVIDGQQRLTTLFILYQVLAAKRAKHYANDNRDEEDDYLYKDIIPEGCSYTIAYSTRNESEQFLANITKESYVSTNGEISIKDKARETPDFLYMWHAYDQINGLRKWEIDKVAYVLKNNVKIIWYSLPGDVPAQKKFSDLNIGKIGLTNSELIKALFLQSTENTPEEELELKTIVTQWDRIERELSTPDFWNFLAPGSKPATRIDLLFDLIAERPTDKKRDKFYTFRYFLEEIKKVKSNSKDRNKAIKKYWDNIFLKYLYLRDWFSDRDLYHRIGYLISTQASDENKLQVIFNHSFSKNVDKTKLKDWLDEQIRQSLDLTGLGVSDFAELKYNAAPNPESSFDNKHHPMIKRVLTLYNIMLSESIDKKSRYSFEHHNEVSGGWSLEHIHAQNSEIPNKQEHWIKWITAHCESAEKMVRRVKEEHRGELASLIKEMRKLTSPQRHQFADIQTRYGDLMGRISGEGASLYKDELANLALLGKDANAQLNNSTFDVKRRKLMENMIGSQFIPVGTERVFTKAIKGNDIDNLHFWTQDDRMAYLADIKEKLHPYNTNKTEENEHE